MDFLLPASAVVGFVVFWSLCVRIFSIPDYLIPAPEVIAVQIVERWPLLSRHSLITLNEILAGFFMSIVINRTFERVTLPLLVMSQSIPKVAIAPIFVIWLGFGLLPKIAVAFLIAFFPILIATVAGLKSVEPDMLDLVKTMGGSARQLIWKVRVPHALPQFFSGLKISICLSVVGAIVGEFVGSDAGLGFLILTSSGDLDSGLLFSTLAILIVIGIVLFGTVSYLEKIALPWHVSVRIQEESLWQS